MLPTIRTCILNLSALESIEGRAGAAPAPPGHMIFNNLLESGDYIDVGKVASDSSVHLVQQTAAAAAWVVASGTE